MRGHALLWHIMNVSTSMVYNRDLETLKWQNHTGDQNDLRTMVRWSETFRVITPSVGRAQFTSRIYLCGSHWTCLLNLTNLIRTTATVQLYWMIVQACLITCSLEACTYLKFPSVGFWLPRLTPRWDRLKLNQRWYDFRLIKPKSWAQEGSLWGETLDLFYPKFSRTPQPLLWNQQTSQGILGFLSKWVFNVIQGLGIETHAGGFSV